MDVHDEQFVMDTANMKRVFVAMLERAQEFKKLARETNVTLNRFNVTAAEFVAMVAISCDGGLKMHTVATAYTAYLKHGDVIELWDALYPSNVLGLQMECPNIDEQKAKRAAAARELSARTLVYPVRTFEV